MIGGDIHSFWANDLKLDFDDPASPVVATEFVGTSISSYPAPYDLFAKRCPTIRTSVSSRAASAAMSASISTPKVIDAHARRVRRHRPQADLATLKTFAVESGQPGVVEA